MVVRKSDLGQHTLPALSSHRSKLHHESWHGVELISKEMVQIIQTVGRSPLDLIDVILVKPKLLLRSSNLVLLY